MAPLGIETGNNMTGQSGTNPVDFLMIPDVPAVLSRI